MSKRPPKPFEVLQIRLSEAFWRWKTWKQIFTGDVDARTSRYELMYRWGPSFFEMLQDVLLNDVLLRICRLADPEFLNPRHSNRRRNLSLDAAVSDASRRLGPTAQMHAAGLLRDFQEAVEPLMKWRHRRWAHDDHRTALGEEVLPRLQLERIEQCLSAAAELMEMLDASPGEFGYDSMLSQGDGESLLYALRCAEQYQKDCMAQYRPMIR